MKITFRPYKRRDGSVMLYINRSNGISVGLSGTWSPYGKNITQGQRNAMDAAKQVFFANAAPFTGDLALHSEGGACAPVSCGPYVLVSTDTATVGGMATGFDGSFVVRDNRILRCGVAYDEPDVED